MSGVPPNRPGVVNKFQLPTSNAASLLGTGVVNKFTQLLQNNTKQGVSSPPNNAFISNYIVFSTPGTYTWTNPLLYPQLVTILAIGSGGGGGGGNGTLSGGAGGSGGSMNASLVVFGSQTLTITIGAGGAGGGAGSNGANGENTSIFVGTSGSNYFNFQGGYGGTASGGAGGSARFMNVGTNFNDMFVTSAHGNKGQNGGRTEPPATPSSGPKNVYIYSSSIGSLQEFVDYGQGGGGVINGTAGPGANGLVIIGFQP